MKLVLSLDKLSLKVCCSPSSGDKYFPWLTSQKPEKSVRGKHSSRRAKKRPLYPSFPFVTFSSLLILLAFVPSLFAAHAPCKREETERPANGFCFINRLQPNISIHILHILLYKFALVLTRRICLAISAS